jgi:hypothetical protein
MGVAVAPGSRDDDLEWLRSRVEAMRSITAGFRMTSGGGRREDGEKTRASATGWTGLRGVSILPSMLIASSLRARFGSTAPRSLAATLSKVAFPERLGLGAASVGLLMLLRPVVRLGKSSKRAAPPRAASISMRPCTVTGARDALAVAGVPVFAIFDRFWTLVEGVLGLDAVVIDEALDDCGAVVCDSEVGIPEEDNPDV